VLKEEERSTQLTSGYWTFHTETMIKVCLKCGKVVDKIRKREERQKKEKERKQKRQDLAKRIYLGEINV
jgi:hypothetical protein